MVLFVVYDTALEIRDFALLNHRLFAPIMTLTPKIELTADKKTFRFFKIELRISRVSTLPGFACITDSMSF